MLFIFFQSIVFILATCKFENKNINCGIERVNGTDSPILCNLNIPENIKDLKVKNVKVIRDSKPCEQGRSFRLVKKKKKWMLRVWKGCRGVFQITFRKTSKFLTHVENHSLFYFMFYTCTMLTFLKSLIQFYCNIDCLKKCGRNAFWKENRKKGGKCQCKTGYIGNPTQQCSSTIYIVYCSILRQRSEVANIT